MAQFIGSQAMNLMPGRSRTVGRIATVALSSGLEARVAIPTRPGDVGMELNLGVGPEDIRETDGPPVYEGTVELTEVWGEVMLLYFGTTSGAAPIRAKLSGIHRKMNRRRERLTTDLHTLHLSQNGRFLLYRDDADTLQPCQPRAAMSWGHICRAWRQ